MQTDKSTGTGDGQPGPPGCFRVEVSLPVGRLDSFLQERIPGVSRSSLQRLIREGAIRVDGRAVKPTHRPLAGERIAIEWPPARPATVQPREMPLDIVHEDAALLVLNKPPGLVVHPAAGHAEDTLVNALLHHCRGQLSGIGGVARPGVVHRLDQGTSGLMVVAKSDAVHLGLCWQFAHRQVEKYYHVVVCGTLANEEGSIEAAIARHPNHRKCMAVSAGGRPALTGYRVLERLREATLLEARLHTGRTHQVRVHFKHLGHAVVGDLIYGKRANARLEEATGCRAPRQMLHAQTLAFTHPVTGERLRFTAPWPADFAAVVEQLRLQETLRPGRDTPR